MKNGMDDQKPECLAMLRFVCEGMGWIMLGTMACMLMAGLIIIGFCGVAKLIAA